MNYNIPLNSINYNQVMDPFFRIQILEQELQRMKNIINNLDNRVSKLEDNKNSNYLDSNVSNKDQGLYML